MTKELFNFHGNIAYPMELMIPSILGEDNSIARPIDKLYDADAIENGAFAELMIEAVRKITGYSADNDEANAFVRKCIPYIGKSAHEIPENVIEALFSEFKAICKK